jgi:hypothetical protein
MLCAENFHWATDDDLISWGLWLVGESGPSFCVRFSLTITLSRWERE